MKKIITALALVASICFAANAQEQHREGPKGKGGHNPEKMLNEMTTTLSLTKDQQEKIKNIMKESKETMQANREKYKGNHKCMAKARFQTRKATNEKIMGVLTAEQKTKFEAEKKRRMEERKKKREEELSKPIEC